MRLFHFLAPGFAAHWAKSEQGSSVGKDAREVIRRTSILLLEFLALVVAGITVIAVLVGLRLASGPLQLDFLTPHIEQALSASDGSYKIRLDRTVLIWGGWERTLDLRARGVRMIGADGAERAGSLARETVAEVHRIMGLSR